MKFRLYLKSFNGNALRIATQELQAGIVAVRAIYQIGGIVFLPVKKKRFCVLRSPNGDKDSREHFEICLHKCFFDFSTESPLVLNTLLKTRLPAGIGCAISFFRT